MRSRLGPARGFVVGLAISLLATASAAVSPQRFTVNTQAATLSRVIVVVMLPSPRTGPYSDTVVAPSRKVKKAR